MARVKATGKVSYPESAQKEGKFKNRPFAMMFLEFQNELTAR